MGRKWFRVFILFEIEFKRFLEKKINSVSNIRFEEKKKLKLVQHKRK